MYILMQIVIWWCIQLD